MIRSVNTGQIVLPLFLECRRFLFFCEEKRNSTATKRPIGNLYKHLSRLLSKRCHFLMFSQRPSSERSSFLFSACLVCCDQTSFRNPDFCWVYRHKSAHYHAYLYLFKLSFRRHLKLCLLVPSL